MGSIREILQNIGIDAKWAIFVIAVGLALVLAAGAWIVLDRLTSHLKKIPPQNKSKGSSLLLSAVCRIKSGLVFTCVFLWVLSYWSMLAPSLQKYAVCTVMVLMVFQIGLIIDGILKPFLTENSRLHPASSIGTIGLFLSRTILWVSLTLIVLDNLGVKITALIAGLGVGGIAIALAIKSILEDIFASLTLALDRPFAPGDSIAIGEFRGTVETIGIKTTRVRSVDGEMLIFPNSDLLQSRLRNFGRMQERRVVFVIGVTYETSPEKIRKACKLIEEAILSHEKTRLERIHFLNFNTSSLDIEVVYWVRSPKFDLHANIKQAINLSILEKFNDAGIEFAYPTQRNISHTYEPTSTQREIKNES